MQNNRYFTTHKKKNKIKVCSNLFYNELFENIIRDEAVNEIEIEKVVMHFKIINYVIYIFYLLQILERNNT